jgi:hypothetical protein
VARATARRRDHENRSLRGGLERLDGIFRDDDKKKRTIAEKRCYAVRQVRGPDEHDDLVVMAINAVDAHRQFFNYYGLNEQTFRYTLGVVQTDDPELTSMAVECEYPRHPGGGGTESMTIDQLARYQHDDVEKQLAPQASSGVMAGAT